MIRRSSYIFNSLALYEIISSLLSSLPLSDWIIPGLPVILNHLFNAFKTVVYFLLGTKEIIPNLLNWSIIANKYLSSFDPTRESQIYQINLKLFFGSSGFDMFYDLSLFWFCSSDLTTKIKLSHIFLYIVPFVPHFLYLFRCVLNRKMRASVHMSKEHYLFCLYLF